MAHDAPVSPLAPKSAPEIPPLEGVRFAVGAAGVRYAGRTDVMLALLDEGTTVAGVFTKSKCPSAPVDWCRDRLKGGKARALLVNSGNANAFTGKTGAQAVKFSAKLAAAATGAPERQIFLASTGVIGEPLDAHKFDGVLEKLAQEARPDGWLDAARAIMTTDTYPKLATRTSDDRRRRGDDQRHRQGRGHDRAGHGDDARLRLHRRRHRRRGAAGDARERRQGQLQRHHRRQRHVDLRHAAALCDRRGEEARRAEDRKGERQAARSSSSVRSTPCCSISPIRW